MKKICLVGVVSAFLLIASTVYGVDINVGVYAPDTCDGIFQTLKTAQGIAVDYIEDEDLTSSTLSKINVLVVAQANAEYWPHKSVEIVRGWVQKGGGLMVTHDAVGYRRTIGIFPEVAKGIGNPYDRGTGYGKKCVVVSAHPITQGIKVKDIVEHTFYDQIVMEITDKARVIAREAIILNKGNVETGKPVIVAAEIGKGRYVANGLLNGYDKDDGEVVPTGAELKIFINSIFWLASKEKYSVGKEIGKGVKIEFAE